MSRDLVWNREPVKDSEVTFTAQGVGSFFFIIESHAAATNFRFLVGYRGKLPLSSTWSPTLPEAKQLAQDFQDALLELT